MDPLLSWPGSLSEQNAGKRLLLKTIQCLIDKNPDFTVQLIPLIKRNETHTLFSNVADLECLNRPKFNSELFYLLINTHQSSLFPSAGWEHLWLITARVMTQNPMTWAQEFSNLEIPILYSYQISWSLQPSITEHEGSWLPFI